MTSAAGSGSTALLVAPCSAVMDAGSGARKPITESMIHRVASQVEVPVIVGGGIRDAEKAWLNCKAGADIIVVGNAIEKDASLIREIADAVHQAPVTSKH